MMVNSTNRHCERVQRAWQSGKMPWIASSLAFLAMTMFLLSSPAQAHDEVKPRLISVSGKAEKTYDPDKVDIVLAIEGQDKELKTAKRKHDELLNALHKVARDFGVDKKDVKTLSNSIQPRYEYRDKNNTRVLAGYSATHRVQVTFKSLDKIGDFVNAITKVGIDQLQSMSFGLIDSNAAEREVMLMAVKDARAKSDAVAATLGVLAPKVYSVNVAGGGGYRPQPVMARGAMMAMDMAESAPAAEVPLNDVTIQQNVSAQFEIQ